jgi:methylated-DNA-protein-cysteine methyltransferase-like protein
MSCEELKAMIRQQIAAIPRGKVATYGQIARLCGYPGYARYVGSILKQLPQSTLLPWQRVINAKGQIAFPPGSEACQIQRDRLQQEGIAFEGDTVSLRRYQWDGISNDNDG